MKSEVKQDTIFFREKAKLCREISELVDKNVHSLNTMNYSCVNRAFFTESLPTEEFIRDSIADYLNDMDKMCVGLLSYSVHERIDLNGSQKYKVVVCGELNQ